MVCGGFLPVLGFIATSYQLVEPSWNYVYEPGDASAIDDLHKPVGMVLGAGVTKDGKPYKELQARLDVAAEAFHKGQVSKIIVSGDNRFEYYNEPKAMVDYLVNTKHIPKNKLQPDYAGRSTYESCDRAANVFGMKDKPLVLFSAASHLPRAIYLCRQFGVVAYGIPSHLEANNAFRHEVIARPKAVFNVYVYGEKTILGEPIRL